MYLGQNKIAGGGGGGGGRGGGLKLLETLPACNVPHNNHHFIRHPVA